MTLTRENILTVLPLAFGGLFPLLVTVEHWLVRNSMLGARGAIGIEFVYLTLCAIAMLLAAGVAYRKFRDGRPFQAIGTLANIVICIVLLGIGINNGAAIVYAT